MGQKYLGMRERGKQMKRENNGSWKEK